MRARLLSVLVLGLVVGGAAVLLVDPGPPQASAGASSNGVNATPLAAGHVHGGATTALTGTTPCEKSGPPASNGQTEHGHRGPFPWTAVTDPGTRNLLAQQLAIAHQVTVQYPTVKDAEAAGYHMTTTYVPCIGAHYINAAYLGGFDPAHPAMLLYSGTTPDATIVGLSYAALSGAAPPAGFAGGNAIWHQHNLNGGLCLRGAVVVGAESTSPAECAARGGTKVKLDSLWMMHAWVADGWPSSWGIFSAEHPDLGGSIGNING
jgi:hypothetical protein